MSDTESVGTIYTKLLLYVNQPIVIYSQKLPT